MEEEELLLVRPDGSYARQIAEYRQEFLRCQSSMDGCGPLARMEDPLEWIEAIEKASRGEGLPEGWVPCTQFLWIRKADGRLLGMIQLRHECNDFLRDYGGHIGYSIRPTERRRGYAKRMLAACLPHARALGLQKILITCRDDNTGSRRTILANGGVYESTVFEPERQVYLERYWIPVE